MDEITLNTINNSINQVNNRIGDFNNRLDDFNNRINGITSTMRSFSSDNSKCHTDIKNQISYACKLISEIDKQNSLTGQCLENHLEMHKIEDEKDKNIKDYIISLTGPIIGGLIGATAVFFTLGI